MRNITRIWYVLLCATVCFSATVSADPISNKSRELSQVNGEIQSLRQTIVYNQQRQSNLQQRLKNTEIALSKLSKQLAQLTQSLTEEQKILTSLQATQQTMSDKLKTQNEKLAQQLRAAYQLGETQHWKIILNQQDPSSMSRHVAYYRYLNQTRLKLISEVKQNLLLLSESIRSSDLHQQVLKKLVEEKQQQQSDQQRVLNLRQKLIAQIGAQTRTKEQQIDVLLANQRALQETITRLKEQNIAINSRAFNKLQGRLAWPVRGSLLASFGSELDVGNQRLMGVTIKTSPGTPVRAIYSGKVIFADWLRGYGLLVIINHGHNYMSLYGRNEAIYAKVGHYVRTGDVIALTGNSGGYNKASLYFEIRENGSPVNPNIWCR